MNNTRTRLLILLPVLLGAAWLALFGDKTPSNSAVVEPVVQPTPAASDAASAESEETAASGDKTPGQVRRIAKRVAPAAGDPVDLFAAVGGGAAAAAAQPENQAPPAPPPQQPFSLIGRMFDHNQWVAFLERDGRTHVVRARDVVDGFRFDAVAAQEIRLTQLSDNSRFVIPIEGEMKEPAHD